MKDLPQEVRDADCWDWLTVEQVRSHAVAAYRMAQRGCRPPEGDRFAHPGDGSPWCDRFTFGETLAELFEARVKRDMHLAGLGSFVLEVEKLALWDRPVNPSINNGTGAS